MLISFLFKNFRSFRDEAFFSMQAVHRLKEKLDRSDTPFWEPVPGLKIHKSAVVYGSNASGKSNFINALFFFRHFVFDSLKLTENQEINVTPFLFDDFSSNEPTEFQIEFVVGSTLYTYGYSLTRKKVLKEWLYKKDAKSVAIFTRDGSVFKVIKQASVLNEIVEKKMVRPDTLLLPLGAQFNDSICGIVINWFRNLNVINGINDSSFRDFTINQLKNTGNQAMILDILKKADLGIESIKLNEKDGIKFGFQFKPGDRDQSKILEEKTIVTELKSVHSSFDKEGYPIESRELSFIEESLGTQKFLNLLGPIVDTLVAGKVLVIDELDTSLHPLLLIELVRLFTGGYNESNAQLIFATHSTSMLKANVFRRDQIWLTDKNRFGVSNLYSLSDYKNPPRNDEAIEKNYLDGRYGGVPYLNDIRAIYEASPKKA